MKRFAQRSPRRPEWDHARFWLPALALLGVSHARADVIEWSNTSGGLFSVGSNWIGGVVPGADDQARFSRTRDPNNQADYTVTFSSNPSNVGLVVGADRVAFALNGHAYLLTSSGSAITVGTTQGGSGRLTIADGAVATTAADPNAFIGTSGVPGALIISTGGQLLGPNLWVGGGGPGALTIQGGGDFLGQDLLIGGLAGSPSSVGITGAGSVAVIDGGLGVGALSSGSLSISTGGRVESTRGVLGQAASTIGTVSVGGAGSRWMTSEEVVVGHSGQGTMTITGGGVIESDGVSLGANPGGTGTATVDGAGSQWNNTGIFIVGESGDGSLSFTAGGYVGTGSVSIARFSGSGTVSVTGPGARLGVGYRLTVGGDFDLQANGGAGSLFIGPGGAVETEFLDICPDDVVDLDGGTLEVYRMDLLFDSSGEFLFHSGTLGARFIQFHFANQGGTLAPGYFGETVIAGSYTQHAGAEMEIDVGGIEPLEITQVHVGGNATLGGRLEVRLINGFMPGPEDTCVVLEAANINGFFGNAANRQRLDTSDGTGSFIVHYGPGSEFDPAKIVLSDFRVCIADFNGDGTADTRDVIAFLNAWSARRYTADCDANGLFDTRDVICFLNIWSAGC